MLLKITASLVLLSVTHALLYAFKKMEGVQIPLDFFILFFMKDVFRSLPFILNFSFALTIGVWQHQQKLRKYDIAALVSGYSFNKYNVIYIFFGVGVISLNILSLFLIYPSMNYKIETELHPKILHNTMLALPIEQAYKIDDNNIFYFKSSLDKKSNVRLFEHIQILNFDEEQKPMLVQASRGSFYKDKNTLFLSEGEMKRVSTDGTDSSSLSFNQLEYNILPEEIDVSYHSLSIRQLLLDDSAIVKGHLFWKIFLSFIPIFLVLVLKNHHITIKFAGAFNLELAVVTSYYLLIIILGLLATKFIENSQYSLLQAAILSFIVLGVAFRAIYNYVTK